MANVRLALTSPVASGGVAHYLDTSTTYSAGNLLELRNATTAKFTVDYAGVVQALLATTATMSGVVSVDDTTDTTSGITGSVHTDGGVGIAKALFVGTTSTLTGTVGVGVAPTATAQVTVAASTTGVASLNVPHGAAPTSPVDGDMWTTTAGLYVRINGSTVGPLA